MHQPHDHLFRAIFAAPLLAASLLRHVVPAALAAIVDWDTVQPAPPALLDRELAAHEPDLLFTAPVRGGGEVLLLLEHKSKAEPFAALQALRYIFTLWQRWLDQERAPAPLPLVLPVVVHHDRRPWRTATTLRELLPEAPAIRAAAPDLRLCLLDLAGRSEAEVHDLELPPPAALCLLHLSFARWMSPPEFAAAIERWADLYRAVAATVGLGALAVFHSYALWVTDMPRAELAQRMAGILGAPVGDHVMSTAEKLIAEGKAEGKAELLLQQLRRRFGPAADSCRSRLLAADSADLDRWALRVLDAQSLDQMFSD